VQRKSSGRYEIHYENHVKRVSGRSKAYRFVKRRSKGHSMILQRYIHLAKTRGRPFDLRVMVQKKPGRSRWKVTGMLAKVAGRRYIVTNIRRSGGKVVSAKTALRRSNVKRLSA